MSALVIAQPFGGQTAYDQIMGLFQSIAQGAKALVGGMWNAEDDPGGTTEPVADGGAAPEADGGPSADDLAWLAERKGVDPKGGESAPPDPKDEEPGEEQEPGSEDEPPVDAEANADDSGEDASPEEAEVEPDGKADDAKAPTAEEIAEYQQGAPLLRQITDAIGKSGGDPKVALVGIAKEIGAPEPYAAAKPSDAPKPLDKTEIMLSSLEKRGYEGVTVDDIDDLVESGDLSVSDLEGAQTWAAEQVRTRQDEIRDWNDEQERALQQERQSFERMGAEADQSLKVALGKSKAFQALSAGDQEQVSTDLRVLALNDHFGGTPIDKAVAARVERFGAMANNAKTMQSMAKRKTRVATPGAAGAPNKKAAIKLGPIAPHNPRAREDFARKADYFDQHGHAPDE